MPQNDYTIVTDPSGGLLQELNEVIYQNYDTNYMPTFNNTYKLTNISQTTIAKNFIPYSSTSSLRDVQDYMVFDASDVLYITNRGGNIASIDVFILDGTSATENGRFQNIGYTFEMFHCPYGIAFDASGILYVTMNDRRQWSTVTDSWILKINTTTLVGTRVQVNGANFGHLYGCTFDSSGNFYVADNTNNEITKITMTDYATGTASTYANLYSGLNKPTDIKFDAQGNGYICNLGANNVITISNTGINSVFGSGLNQPYTLGFNNLDSILYVANLGITGGDGSIVRIINGSTTKVPAILPGPGPPTPGGLANAYSIAINNDNKLLVSDIVNIFYPSLTGGVTIYQQQASNFIGIYGNEPPYSTTNIGATCVTFDSGYNFLYLCAYNTNEIWKYTNSALTGNSRIIFYNDSSTGPSLNLPTSIAFDGAGNLYVSNNSDELIVITPAGIGTLVAITGPQPLSLPSSIEFGGAGKLYIANYSSNNIMELTFSSISTATSIILPIIGDPIVNPTSLSFNGSSYTKLYVSCAGVNTILEIDIATSQSSQYNLSGLELSNPTGLYYDETSSILYICNEATSEIYMITNYNYVTKLVLYNQYVGEPIINNPLSIALDADSNLYIANNASLTFDESASIPVISIQQNHKYASQYSALLTYTSATTNSVIDRTSFTTYNVTYDIGSTYVYQLNKVGTLELGTIIPSLPGSTRLETIVFGEDNTNNKFLAAISTSTIPVQIAFIQVQTNGSIPGGITYNVQNTGVSFNMEPLSSAFADVNSTTKSIFIASGTDANVPPFPPQFARFDVTDVSIPNNTTFTSTTITINGLPPNIVVSHMSVYPSFQSGNYTQYLYIGERDTNNIYRVDITSGGPIYNAVLYINLIGGPGKYDGCKGLSLDDNGYLYVIGDSNGKLFRVDPNASNYITLYNDLDTTISNLRTLTYCNWDQSLYIFSPNSRQLFKYYIGFPFVSMLDTGTIGEYDNTSYIFDITAGNNTFDLSFNIYDPYVVINPSTIPINTPTNTSIHFVTPLVQPDPNGLYKLLCDDNDVANIFCNNCTYNKSKFLAATYPISVVYSTDTDYLYVGLENNTISRISTLGAVANNYIPSDAGLQGPSSLVLDASYNMFVLNTDSNFITYLTLLNNIISIDNTFFTNIDRPISLTYDNATNYLYLLSGVIPNIRITKILGSDGSISEILPIPFGVLYDSNGLSVDDFDFGTKYLYVSDTDQNGTHKILQFNLSDGLYTSSILINNMSYKPFTITNKNDGYLYVANKLDDNISKIAVQGPVNPQVNTQPWVSQNISVPSDITFDGSGNLYVANSGTGPRNSRISKIYIDYFYFTNVVLTSVPCTGKIYDVHTQSYLELNYDPSDPYTFPIPIPYPINT